MPTTSRNHLLHALRRVLRPIVRVLIRAGIRFDEFAELARGVFVETAIRDGLDNVSVPTRARVSVVTGVSKQQVDYYIDNKDAIPSANRHLPASWLKFCKVAHRSAVRGCHTAFRWNWNLNSVQAAVVSGLLSDWSRRPRVPELCWKNCSGSVGHLFRREHFRAVSRYFMMPEPMSPQQIEYFGNTMTRLAQTLEFNMDPKNSNKRLERFVLADRGLPADILPKFESYARERATGFLLDLDNWLTPYSTPNSGDDSPRMATGLNVFIYVEPPPDESALVDLVQPTPEGRANE